MESGNGIGNAFRFVDISAWLCIVVLRSAHLHYDACFVFPHAVRNYGGHRWNIHEIRVVMCWVFTPSRFEYNYRWWSPLTRCVFVAKCQQQFVSVHANNVLSQTHSIVYGQIAPCAFRMKNPCQVISRTVDTWPPAASNGEAYWSAEIAFAYGWCCLIFFFVYFTVGVLTPVSYFAKRHRWEGGHTRFTLYVRSANWLRIGCVNDVIFDGWRT